MITNVTTSAQQAPLFKEIGRTLTELGIFPHLKGHHDIKAIVLKRIESQKNNKISKTFSSTCKKEASNIRSALRVAENSGMLVRINDILGMRIVDKHCHFSPVQFISLLAHYFLYL